MFIPTAGIETLESDAERLKDSSSPRGARPSVKDVIILLLKDTIQNINFKFTWNSYNITCDWIGC